MQLEIDSFVDQFKTFPSTRYMGSKNKIIFNIWHHLREVPFDSFYDSFAGSNVVSYFMKCNGKRVITNDFMSFSHIHSKAVIENHSEKISAEDLSFLLQSNENNGFITNTFKDIFFADVENAFLDTVRYNISKLDNEYKRALSLSALVRSCLKKRSRGVFTFIGERYNDGRADEKNIKGTFYRKC
jgi:DNA adenine methylase